MKKLILISLTACLILSLAGCKKSGEGKASPSAKASATATAKATATASPTAEATPKPTVVPLPAEKIGKPQADAKVLFEDEFANDDVNSEAAYEGSVAFADGKMYLSHEDATTPADAPGGYNPNFFYTPGEEYTQYEFHVKFSTKNPSTDPNYWMAMYAGVRMGEGVTSALTKSDDGIFLAFSSKTDAYIYTNDFPTSTNKVALPEKVETMHELIIVDSGSLINYYLVLADGTQSLFMTVESASDTYTVKDAAGTVVYESSTALQEGGYFLLWNHMGITVVESVIIKAS